MFKRLAYSWYLRMQTESDTCNPPKMWNNKNGVLDQTKVLILSNHTTSEFMNLFCTKSRRFKVLLKTPQTYLTFSGPELNIFAPTREGEILKLISALMDLYTMIYLILDQFWIFTIPKLLEWLIASCVNTHRYRTSPPVNLSLQFPSWPSSQPTAITIPQEPL